MKKDLENEAVLKVKNYCKENQIDDIYLCDDGSQTDLFKRIDSIKNLIDFSSKKDGEVLDFIQTAVIHELTDMADLEKSGDYISDVKYILKFIDIDILKQFRSNDAVKFLIVLKNGDFSFKTKKNKVLLKSNDVALNRLHNHKINLDIVEVAFNHLNISGVFSSLSDYESISIEAVLKGPAGVKEIIASEHKEYPTTGRCIKKKFGISWKYPYSFDLKVPLNIYENYSLALRVVFNQDNQKAVFYPEIVFKPYCNLSMLSNYFIHKSKIILFRQNQIHVLNFSKSSMLKLEFQSILNILRSDEEGRFYSIFIRFIYLILFAYYRNKRIWLFMDRPAIADDNGKHLFSYSVRQDDGIEKYYVLDKNSDDFDDMKKISKNIVPLNSLKHKILYLFSEKLLSSHVNHEWVNPFYFNNVKLYSGLITIKKCFLQHGVTKDDVSFWLKKYYNNFYLITTSSELEYNAMSGGNFNYSKEVINILGMPRFDNLKNNAQNKQILFLPSWRRYLKDEKEFAKSNYFKWINGFFTNEELLKFLKEKGYTIVFKPHFDLMPYLDLFNIPDEVEINLKDSYQDLFNNASLLITDYSSVFFDFAYIKKPVIYYRGEDEYHYDKGYFNYETMGFGDVINSEEKFIEKLTYYINNGCEMEEKYKKRVDDFFKFTDKNNCKRVYEWVYSHND